MAYYICDARQEAIDASCTTSQAVCLYMAAISGLSGFRGPWAEARVRTADTKPRGYIVINSWLLAKVRELGWIDVTNSLWWAGDEATAEAILEERVRASKSFLELLAMLGVHGAESLRQALVLARDALAAKLSHTEVDLFEVDGSVQLCINREPAVLLPVCEPILELVRGDR